MLNTLNKEKIIQTIIHFKEECNLLDCIKYLENELQQLELTLQFFLEEKHFLSQLKNELGLCYLSAEQYEKAEKIYYEALQLNPYNINALYNLADFYFQTKQFENAILKLEDVLKIDACHVPSIYLIGLCYSCMGEPHQALGYFLKTTELDSNSLGGNYWAGECYLYQQEFNLALPYFEKSCMLNPQHLDSYRGLAICYLETENPEKALVICDSIIGKNTIESISMYQIKGEALIKLQDFKQAGIFHRQVALLELDARDYLLFQANKIFTEYNKEKAQEYIEIILEKIPEMKPSFEKIINKISHLTPKNTLNL